eukprot:1672438-Amphidinium_carterae.1
MSSLASCHAIMACNQRQHHPSRSLATILLSRDMHQHGSRRQSSQQACFAGRIDKARVSSCSSFVEAAALLSQ